MGLPLAWSWRVCRVTLAPPSLLGPPCMETFLNKPRTSSSAAFPVSSCISGGSGVMVGGVQSQAGLGLGIPQHTGEH